MGKLLFKRAMRQLKSGLPKWLALMFMVTLSMILVSILVSSSVTMIDGSDNYAKEYKVEDGSFGVLMPLSDSAINEVENLGVKVEPMFSMDLQGENNKEIRVFKPREDINKVAILEGNEPKNDYEIIIERRFSEVNNLKVGDKITLEDKDFTISAIGVSPDYQVPTKSFSDASPDSEDFGLGWLNNSGYNNIKDFTNNEIREDYSYSYIINGNTTDKKIQETLKEEKIQTPFGEMNNLTFLLSAEDNPRINGVEGDQEITRQSSLFAGIFVLLMFTYVISVFVTHQIEDEAGIIGSLYALGLRKRDLLIHYLTIPVIVTFIGGLIGLGIGLLEPLVRMEMATAMGYFSLPTFPVLRPWYIWVYGLVIPPLVAFITNVLVINKKLNRPALSLIRREVKQGKIHNIHLKGSMLHRFQIRQMLNEVRTSVAILLSMFLCLLILNMGLDVYSMCNGVKVEAEKDVKFDYMYSYALPEIEVPENGNPAYIETFTKENLGYKMDISLMGIENDNPYFNVDTNLKDNEVVISSAMAQKFSLEVGEEFQVNRKSNEENYTFIVKDIAKYDPAFYMFTDIKNVGEILDFEDEEDEAEGVVFNTIFASEKLDIPEEKLMATIKGADIIKASETFINLMMPMVTMSVVLSALIFLIVMYLMIKILIGRSSQNIALLQIIGYRTKELRKMYLNGNFMLIAIGALIIIPLSKMVMDMLYPYMVANVISSINLTYPFWYYIAMFVGLMLVYFIVNHLSVRKIQKITPAVILKDRDAC